MMPARRWLVSLIHYLRYTVILVLLSVSLFVLNWTFTPLSNDHVFTFDDKNNVLPMQSRSVDPFLPTIDQLPFTNRTLVSTNNRTLRLAVVSAIYNDGYFDGVQMLAYSLRRANTQADLILLYIPDRISPSILDRCRLAGWHLWPVERIHPPRFAIIYPRFRDQYTKLRIWSMVGYDRILYLDADTLVLRDINELFIQTLSPDSNDGLLGAVEDVWQGQIGPNFNAGVLLINPNETIFNDMLVRMHDMAAYGSYWAEQGFLNWYFKGSTGRLPLIYNFNSALAIYHHDIYAQLRSRAKIIHYTIFKPFHITDADQLPDPVFNELWLDWRQMQNDMLKHVNSQLLFQ